MSDVQPHARPRAVVFDLDGLMFNTEELYQWVGGEVLRRRGGEFTPELISLVMGRPGPIALQMMIDHSGIDATVAELAEESMTLFETILDTRLELMPGLENLLSALENAKLPKAIATSSSRRFVTNVLGRFGLERRFAFILTSEDVTHGKPNPEIYLKAAVRLGHDPAQVLVLEDSHNGCRAAAAAGTQAVAVPSGHSRAHDFSCASLVIDTLADPRLYERLGLAFPD